MTAATFKRHRQRLALNAADMGALLGVSSRTVESWEQGRRSIPASVELRLTGKCPTCGARGVK